MNDGLFIESLVLFYNQTVFDSMYIPSLVDFQVIIKHCHDIAISV